MSVKRVQQLSVFLENQPGVLAKLAQALASGRVNLLGMSVSDTVDHAVVRLVVDNPARARRLLEEANLLVVENDVLAVPLRHEPGALSAAAQKLARAHVNIEYAYGSGSVKKGARAVLFLRVSDTKKALGVLGR
jgi:hypothetical protein